MTREEGELSSSVAEILSVSRTKVSPLVTVQGETTKLAGSLKAVRVKVRAVSGLERAPSETLTLMLGATLAEPGWKKILPSRRSCKVKVSRDSPGVP